MNGTLRVLPNLFVKNETTGNYFALSMDYKEIVREAYPSAGLVSILLAQADPKENISRVLLGMMRRNVHYKELMMAFNSINSYKISLPDKEYTCSDSILDNVDSISSKNGRASRSILSRTLRYVGSIYGFAGSGNRTKNTCILTQEDMFALVFSCLSESLVN